MIWRECTCKWSPGLATSANMGRKGNMCTVLENLWCKLFGTVGAARKKKKHWNTSTSQNWPYSAFQGQITVSFPQIQFGAHVSLLLAIIMRCFTNQNWLLKYSCLNMEYPQKLQIMLIFFVTVNQRWDANPVKKCPLWIW